jgi:hypothetical protein
MLFVEHCFLHKYIFLSVTDIGLKGCGQVFHLKRALLVESIITYKYIFQRLLNIWQIQWKVAINAEFFEKWAKFILNK